MEYRWVGDGAARDSEGNVWEVVSSPDGSWAILTRDADDRYEHVGYRTSGPGRYRLVEGSVTRCQGQLDRPNDARVANNGTFLVSDWLFGDDRRCRVCVFDKAGTPLIDGRYAANVLATGISDDGRFGALQLASNPDAPDFDDRAIVWDLELGITLWSKQLEGGPARTIVLDTAAGVLRSMTSRAGRVEYDLATGSTDIGALRDTFLEQGNGFEVLDLVMDEVATGSVREDRAAVLIAYCEAAAAKLQPYPSHQARALRVAGEIAETQHDPVTALRYWDRALAIDPKVGVRMRAKALRASGVTQD